MLHVLTQEKQSIETLVFRQTSYTLKKDIKACLKPGPQVIEIFHAHSTEHKLFNVHKIYNIKTFSCFSDSDKSRMRFFLLINVKKRTIVGMLTFISRTNYMLS